MPNRQRSQHGSSLGSAGECDQSLTVAGVDGSHSWAGFPRAEAGQVFGVKSHWRQETGTRRVPLQDTYENLKGHTVCARLIRGQVQRRQPGPQHGCHFEAARLDRFEGRPTK